MKTIKSAFLFTIAALYLTIFNLTPAFASFSLEDLTGTWYGHSLTAGNEEIWEHMALTINSQGNVTSATHTNSGGETETEYDVATLSISGSGINTEATSESLNGVMSLIKVLWCSHRNLGKQCLRHTVLTKSGASYSQSDLAGTWYGHAIITGAGKGWEYALTQLTASATLPTVTFTNSDGETKTDYNVAVISIAGMGCFLIPEKRICMVNDPYKKYISIHRHLDDSSYAMTVMLQKRRHFCFI